MKMKGGNDVVYTPHKLAKYIVDYFNPKGKIIEPCSGNGSFLQYLENADWYEIEKGKDFFECNDIYDWAITNPPFSKIRQFLLHLYKLNTKNIVFLCPVGHIISFKARLNDMYSNGYGLKEIIFIDTPKEFPRSGFQWGIIHIKKDYKGELKLTLPSKHILELLKK